MPVVPYVLLVVVPLVVPVVEPVVPVVFVVDEPVVPVLPYVSLLVEPIEPELFIDPVVFDAEVDVPFMFVPDVFEPDIEPVLLLVAAVEPLVPYAPLAELLVEPLLVGLVVPEA